MENLLSSLKLTNTQASQLAKVIGELVNRDKESLHIYEPTPFQERFHSCTKRERLVRGSNRSSKTLVAAVEVARAVTGQDPYEKWPERDGRALIVAKDEREIGQVIYRKLFRQPFKMIRDEDGHWRNYRPWQKYDQKNRTKAYWAPPLIPPRFIKSIAWKNKKANVPYLVKLKHGWEIMFVSSVAKPMKGADLDLVWFDEEIMESMWYDEAQARLFDRQGKFIWSVTPETATEQLYALHERAVDGDAEVEEFHFKLSMNPYFTKAQVEAFASKIRPALRPAKIDGEYLLDAYKVFPEFSEHVHVVQGFHIPDTWTRYMAVDPGHQICAVEYGAIPPDGEHAYIYDEDYIDHCDAAKFAQTVKHKVGTNSFELFFIDGRSAHTHDLGSGKTVEEQYSEQLEENKVASRSTGSGFIWGTDDVKGGIEALHSWFRLRQNGTPKLKIFAKCTELIRELEHYHKKKKPDGTFDDKPVEKNDHAIWCARAFAAHGCPYVKPAVRKRDTGAYAALQAKRKRRAERVGTAPFIHFGPPIQVGWAS